jgi:hypothetical protein
MLTRTIIASLWEPYETYEYKCAVWA